MSAAEVLHGLATARQARARDGGATWLYGDADETGAVSAGASQNADDVAQGSLGDCYLLSLHWRWRRATAPCLRRPHRRCI